MSQAALPPFRRSAPLLLLAPHLRYPIRNGADLTQDGLAVQLSRHVPYVDMVAEHEIIRFIAGQIQSRTPYAGQMRSKPVAALKTILGRSHYLIERFLSPAFRAEALGRLREPIYGTVLFSYIETASLLAEAQPQDGRLHLVYTHNDQLAWFRELARQVSNPVGKWAARVSERWYAPFFERYGSDALFLYLTPADRDGHLAELPPHAHTVLPIGVDVPDKDLSALAPGGPVRLLFVGALSVGMNADALDHFAERYWPSVRGRLEERVEVIVVGSGPTDRIRARCAQEGWTLEADVSDERLAALYERAAFAVLPFPYATGAKLKLLGALAHGTPFLATEQVSGQLSEAPAPAVFSNDPEVWAAACERVLQDGLSVRVRTAMRDEAARHSWEAVVDRFVDALAGPEENAG